MAARGIALGRIIGWFHNADIEEARYAIHRVTQIVADRGETVKRADAHHAAKAARGKKSHHKPKDTRTVADVSGFAEANAAHAANEAPDTKDTKDTKAASAS